MNESANRQQSAQCPGCGEGTLHPHIEHNLTEINGHNISLPLHYSVCDHCGAELTNASQSQANKRAMVAAEKQTHGLLAGESIRALRKQYKLSQIEAAQLFGGGKVGFSRYENDDIVQSQAMDSLLRLCMAHPHNLIKLAAIRQVSLHAKTRQDIQADAHRLMIAIAPKVQKLLESAMANERKNRAVTASNDLQHDKFAITERSVWKAAA